MKNIIRKFQTAVQTAVQKVTDKRDEFYGLTPHYPSLDLGKSSSSRSSLSPKQIKERPRTADYIRNEINRYYDDRVPFKGHKQDLVTEFTLIKNMLINKLKYKNKKVGPTLPITPPRTIGGIIIKSNTPKKKNVKSNNKLKLLKH